VLAAYEKLQLIELILLGGPEYPVCNLANVSPFYLSPLLLSLDVTINGTLLMHYSGTHPLR
jgi:hypothetical protein